MIVTPIRTEGFYVKTAIIHQLKRLCFPDCAHTVSMFIHLIQISRYDISLMQNILYQIKRDVAIWKKLGCPQRKQRTWWQHRIRGQRNYLLHYSVEWKFISELKPNELSKINNHSPPNISVIIYRCFSHWGSSWNERCRFKSIEMYIIKMRWSCEKFSYTWVPL